MRFAAPPAQPTSRVHSSRACRTRYVPPTGFHTLSTACSSAGSRPYFRPERSWSSLPCRAFPSSGAATPLGALVPSCRWRPPRVPSAARPLRLDDPDLDHAACPRSREDHGRPVHGRDSQGVGWGSTSGLCSPDRVRCHDAGGEACVVPDALLGFAPSSGCSLPLRLAKRVITRMCARRRLLPRAWFPPRHGTGVPHAGSPAPRSMSGVELAEVPKDNGRPS